MMTTTRWSLSFVCLMLSLEACGGSSSSGGGAQGGSLSREGVKVEAPSGWSFVEPDASVAKDTVIILQGPAGNEPVVPVVEIGRRALSAMDQRRKPAHVLTATVTELVQTFEGFEGTSEPADVQIAGRTGSRMDMKITEQMPDGTSAQRAARFYGVVDNDSLYLVRCLGPTDGSADSAFDAIIGSIAF